MDGDTCFCVRRCVIRTSLTNRNPSRRFMTCENGGCSFFLWVDPPVCDRAKAVIPGLLRKISAMEEEMRKSWKREKLLWAWAIFSIIIIICK